jgi:hypothetical protein
MPAGGAIGAASNARAKFAAERNDAAGDDIAA